MAQGHLQVVAPYQSKGSKRIQNDPISPQKKPSTLSKSQRHLKILGRLEQYGTPSSPILAKSCFTDELSWFQRPKNHQAWQEVKVSIPGPERPSHFTNLLAASASSPPKLAMVAMKSQSFILGPRQLCKIWQQ